MPFPESPRVVYQRNALEEVICQLRFPTILRIDTDTAAFQERVRHEYPLYSEAERITGPTVPPELAQLVRAGVPITRQFVTADESWRLGLNRDFLALSTNRYHRWEDFRARLEFALTALRETYQPAFLSRVGLRYRNNIYRPALGLANVPWRDLLRPHIAAELSSEDMAASVVEAAHVVAFRLNGQGGGVTLRHGLEQREGHVEPAYVLDADFYAEPRTEIGDVLDRLAHFNQQARFLFRWCIAEQLHQRLEPQDIH